MTDPRDGRGAPKSTKEFWPDKVGPRKISHRHDFIIRLAALGYTAAEISEKTGWTQPRLSIILNNTRVRCEIIRIRDQIFTKDPDVALQMMIPDALKVIGDTLKNPQERAQTRLDASFRLLDRTHGKAKQSIDVGGSLIRDLFEQLDAAKYAKVIDVTTVKPETPKADVIDEWIGEAYAAGDGEGAKKDGK